LPDITGFQILKELRFESVNMFTPVIAFTADVTTSNQRKIVEHGFTAFLSKPFKEDDLLRIFEVILNSTSLSLDLAYYKKYIRESIQYKKAKEIIINELRDFENNISLALFDNNYTEIENQIHKISFLLNNLKLVTLVNLVEELKQKTTSPFNNRIILMKIKLNLLSLYKEVSDDRNWEVLS
jgi:DNA-binding response OmpR family regulator